MDEYELNRHLDGVESRLPGVRIHHRDMILQEFRRLHEKFREDLVDYLLEESENE